MKEFDVDGDTVFYPARPNRATRKMAKRKKNSGSGGVTVPSGPGRPAQVTAFDSLLEMKVLCILLADPTTMDVREQPQGFHYTDATGKRCFYTPDFLWIRTDGSRVLVEVKPHARAVKPEFRARMVAIRSAIHKGIADRLILITDADFTRDQALNAQRLLMFLPHIRPEHKERVNAILPALTYPLTIAEAMDAIGLGPCGFKALFPALFDGRLAVDPGAEFTLETRLHKGEIL